MENYVFFSWGMTEMRDHLEKNHMEKIPSFLIGQ